MPFHIIRGTFHVKGYSPDGDSIRFKADNKSHWGLLSGPPAKLNGHDHAQLRASIMAPATPFCFWTTQKHLAVKRTMGSVT